MMSRIIQESESVFLATLYYRVVSPRSAGIVLFFWAEPSENVLLLAHK
jgi:hypothetical protein